MDSEPNNILEGFSVCNLAWKFRVLLLFEVIYYFSLGDLATFVKVKTHFMYSVIIAVPPNSKKDFKRLQKK